jgi:hypothetical protein
MQTTSHRPSGTPTIGFVRRPSPAAAAWGDARREQSFRRRRAGSLQSAFSAYSEVAITCRDSRNRVIGIRSATKTEIAANTAAIAYTIAKLKPR